MENTDITISGNIATWTLPLTQGEMLGTYSGTFQFKCYLTPTEILQSGRDYRSLLGSLSEYASEREKNIAFSLVELKYRILKAPPFWTSTLQESGFSGNIPDLNILIKILEMAMVSESLFQEKIQKERDLLLERTIKSAEALAEQKNKVEE